MNNHPTRLDPIRTYAGELFTRYGSDKDTNHSYGEFYQNLFPDNLSVRSVLEVGIASGGSVMAFRDLYPNAHIVGFDKEPCHSGLVGSERNDVYPLMPRPERLEIHMGDMRVREDLLRAVNHRQFDLIVEDATHRLPDNLCCLLWLWPWVAPGGYYVIEEMDGVQSYWEQLDLFANARMWEAKAPHAGELLFVLHKPVKL